MKKILVLFSLPLALFFTACGSDSSSDLPSITLDPTDIPPVFESQPVISVDSKKIITKGGLQFKDSNGNGKLDTYEDWRQSPTKRAADLAAQMTLEEKAGLMVHNSPGSVSVDGVVGVDTGKDIQEKHIRFGVARLNDMVTAEQCAIYFNEVQKVSEGTRLGIPFLISLDPMHNVDGTNNAAGLFSNWPMPEGIGAMDDTELTRAYGDAINKEYRAIGVRMQLGPMADVASEPRWARVQNTIAEDFYLVSKHIGPFVKGIQNGDKVSPTSVAAVIKHFPGAGPDEDGMDSHSAPGKHNIYPGGKLADHVRMFQPAFDAGVMAMMPCYSIFKDQFTEQVGAAYSKEIIDLAKSMGFDGMIVSDWGVVTAYGGMMGWGVDGLTPSQKIKKFLEAGSHQDGGASDPTPYVTAVTDGSITEAQLEKAAAKMLEVMFCLGIFENPYVDSSAANATISSITRNLEAQIKSTVLLKNDSVLPIDKSSTTNVYFGGRASDSQTVATNYVAGDNVTIVTATDPTVSADRIAAMESADVAIIRIRARDGIYFGIDAGIPLSFDGVAIRPDGDPSTRDITITGGIDEMFGYPVAGVQPEWDRIQEAITAQGTNSALKIVVVMYAVRPGIVEGFINDIDGFLIDFGATDEAILNLVFGDASPSGKLPMEIPSSDAEVSASFEDVPNDTENPTFDFGDGMTSW